VHLGPWQDVLVRSTFSVGDAFARQNGVALKDAQHQRVLRGDVRGAAPLGGTHGGLAVVAFVQDPSQGHAEFAQDEFGHLAVQVRPGDSELPGEAG